MSRLFDSLYALLLTLWVGSLWAIGYVAAPTLFSTLADRQMAGDIAGSLFAVSGWLGVACGVYVMIYLLARQEMAALKRAAFWLALLMVALTLVSLFGTQPLMAELKAEALPRQVMESVLKDRFAAWHGIASILYLLQSGLGACLVLVAQTGSERGRR